MPVLPVFRQKRSEGLSGGADNGCYGKSSGVAVLFEPAISDFHVGCSMLKSGVLYHLCCILFFLKTSILVTT